MFRRPAPCIICGAAHTVCTADKGPIRTVQLPARDASARADLPPVPLVAELVQATLPEGQFTSATYRRKKAAR